MLKSRIAPTPSGFLHPGNGLSFLMTWVKTREANGQLLLRIDDLDKQRYRQEYVEDIFRTLDWLGIDYDEGPRSVEDFEKNWSQHHRLDTYIKAVDELKENRLLFACECSRKQRREDAIANGHRQYSGRCMEKNIPLHTPNVALRITLPESDLKLTMQLEKRNEQRPFSSIDNFVVNQKNGLPAYQIASLLDDTLYQINYIVRGEDLRPSSWYQLALAHLLNIESFRQTTFWHHPLLNDDDGIKLSKSKGAGSLKDWRENGQSPKKMIQLAAKFMGKDEKIDNIKDLTG